MLPQEEVSPREQSLCPVAFLGCDVRPVSGAGVRLYRNYNQLPGIIYLTTKNVSYPHLNGQPVPFPFRPSGQPSLQ